MSSEEVAAEGARPPPGARFLTDQERTDHVANVMEALTKQVGAHAAGGGWDLFVGICSSVFARGTIVGADTGYGLGCRGLALYLSLRTERRLVSQWAGVRSGGSHGECERGGGISCPEDA